MRAEPSIRRAIGLVVNAFADKKRIGPVSIPSYMHSLSVGTALCKYHCPIEIVIAGICHDLVEDTEVTNRMIIRLFSPRVGFLVIACTLDPELGDTPEGEDELYNRVVKLAWNGDVAPLVIKCVDSADNLKTNADMKPDLQVSAYLRGRKWHQAGQIYLAGHQLLDDFAVILEREKARLHL